MPIIICVVVVVIIVVPRGGRRSLSQNLSVLGIEIDMQKSRFLHRVAKGNAFATVSRTPRQPRRVRCASWRRWRASRRGGVQRLERGEPLRPRTLAAVREALEGAGVEFLRRDHGVRLRAP